MGISRVQARSVSTIASRRLLCYTLFAALFSILRSRKEVSSLEYLANFIVSVIAQVAGYFLCKWLDPDTKRKGK